MSWSRTGSVAESAARRSFSFTSYFVAALLTAAALSLPLLAVRFPPITDLPQQTAQIRLAGEATSGASAYRLNLAAPGAFSYVFFGLSWRLFGAENAGRTAYLFLAWLWAGGLMVLIRGYGRDPVLVPLAGLFFFSHLLYWGFFSFLLGAVLFFFFTRIERRVAAGPGGFFETTALAVASLALYSCHLFWFLAGALWLLLATLRQAFPRQRQLLRAATVLPALMVFMAWAPQLRRSGFVSETSWTESPLARLAPSEWVDRVFGGLKGPVEPFILAIIVIWLLNGLWQHRQTLRTAVSPTLLLLAGSMVFLSLVLPHRYQNTLHFAERWAPLGAALLVAALPIPKFKRWVRWLISLTLIASLSLSTTAIWKRFEDVELGGLSESLAALADEPRLLGLDFYRMSGLVKTQPFFQNHAYAQVLRGGSLGFSFASFPSSPVVFREWRNPPWAVGLEWFPHQIFTSVDDLQYFDSVLVHSDAQVHQQLEQQPALAPVTSLNRWRLYRVVTELAPAAEKQ